MSRLIFEKSVEGRCGAGLARLDVEKSAGISEDLRRKSDTGLPELSELDVVRHYTNLSKLNFSVDSNFYPLGSCTMKYNPKSAEKAAAMEGFQSPHPMLAYSGADDMCQGSLEVVYETERLLAEICGMHAVTTQPLAGAHGEMLGIMLIAEYHKARGSEKKYVIVPDSSHGTNPASAAMVGYEIITVPTAEYGDMDIDAFKEKINGEVAAVMMTCPNTLGLFNPHIKEICDIAHENDALMYYDGANLNAVLGKVRPGDIGFDVIHVNLHKTFATPHGSGGPGSGPVGVCGSLEKYLPKPRIAKENDTYKVIHDSADSLGYITPFFGNFLVVLKAYAYILMLGREGLIDVSEMAVLNANYLMQKLKGYYELPFDKVCMHECVFSASRQTDKGVHALDIAKGLIDKGFHPPTVYFPITVKEAMMIEPTETENMQTLDAFADAMIEIAETAETDPDTLHDAPKNTQLSRLDETQAARSAVLRYEK